MPADATAKPTEAQVMDGLPPERRRWAVAAIFTVLAMASLDTAIANIALPAIAADRPFFFFFFALCRKPS